MISPGLVLLLGAAVMAGTGMLVYLAARRSKDRSRSIALTLFGHGALGTSALLFLPTLIHLHAWNIVHVHSATDSFLQDFVCDIEWSCIAWNAAVIAGIVIVCSFVLSQVVSRAIVARARRLADSAEERHGSTTILTVADERPDAYSVALLRLGGRLGFHAEHFVIVTQGLVGILTPEERRAVLGHELAHIEARDDRYMPFFHALSFLVFFDPFVRQLRNRLGRRYEIEADDAAARSTHNPRALARALLKLYEASAARPAGVAFLGHRRGSEILERIERLLALADEMDEGPA